MAGLAAAEPGSVLGGPGLAAGAAGAVVVRLRGTVCRSGCCRWSRGPCPDPRCRRQVSGAAALQLPRKTGRWHWLPTSSRACLLPRAAGASASLAAGHRKGRSLEGLPTQEGGTLHPSAMLVLALPLIPACTYRSWSPAQLATRLWLMAGSPACPVLDRPQATRDLMLLRCPGVSTQHPQPGRAAAGGDEQRPGTQQGTLEAAATTPSNICPTLHSEESTAAQQGPAHVPAAGGTGQDLLARNADMLPRDRPYQAGLAAWAGGGWPGSYIHPLEGGRGRGLTSCQPPCQLSIPGLCRQHQLVRNTTAGCGVSWTLWCRDQ